MILSVPGVEGHQLDLPLSVHPSARVLALQALVKLAEEWLSNSLRLAPHELRGQLQVQRSADLVGCALSVALTHWASLPSARPRLRTTWCALPGRPAW